MMGWFGSICSGISSCVSAVGSCFSSAASYLGSAFTSMVDKGLAIGKSVLSSVGNIATGLLQSFGIFKEKETVEDMGDRAFQAHEQNIVPEQFDNFDQYLDNLRNFPLDPEKSKEITTDQKIYKGLEVAGRGLDDKFNTPTGTMSKVFELAAQSPDFFTADRFKSILDSGMDIVSIADYFEGKLGAGEALDVEADLFKIEQSLQPGRDDAEIYKKLDDVKDVIQGRVE